ncbi:hypothetical protein ACXHQJ_18825 [Vibrio vulnificus]|uniref:hypothetical protein n=1 Tax=Vibrio vulnificus TaxID=672 RepID=UPI0005F1FD20|nr:hypothetical protein [Vibrio vulnificus]HDY7887130.1 hypothetical protein [Vibrio vulnificus]
MTLKKLSGPEIEHWFNELEAIILHEVVCYLVAQEASKEDKEWWDTLGFSEPERVCLDFAMESLGKFTELDENSDAIEFGTEAATFDGAARAELYLSEKDFLIQVIDSKQISDLSESALYRLYSSYQSSVATIKYCIKNTFSFDFPSCLRGDKLNDDFRIQDLGFHNDIPKIIDYHLHVIDRVSQYKEITMDKPTIFSSIKRNKFIDIYTTHCNDLTELHTIYKWNEIDKHDGVFREEILNYCRRLIDAHLFHLSTDEVGGTPPHKTLPIPPTKQLLVKRYDRYSCILIGLYCLINKELYQKNTEDIFEPTYNSFRDFVENDVFEKFDNLRDAYEKYSNDEAIGIPLYINKILTKRIKSNIKVAEEIIEQVREKYFS